MTTATTATTAVSIAAAASATNGTAAEPMQAVVRHRYGGTERLEVTTVDRPTIAGHEVLIRVRAAGVDRGVWHLMTGLPLIVRLAGFGVRRPKQPVLGMDVAGTVVAVGADVDAFAVGDEVYGIGNGAFAEYATADAAKLAHRPDDLAPEAAATVAISGATAAQAVLAVGRLEPGQRVLVLGASGGVGGFATQVAAAHGAHVTGVASATKAEHVRALGADTVLDYRVDDFTEHGPFDLIIDTGGRPSLRRLRRALTPEGTAVIVGGEGGGKVTGGFGRQLRAMLLSPFIGPRLTTFVNDERAEAWAPLRELIETGRVRPTVDRTYPLTETANAIDDLVGGRVRGKAAIVVG